MRRNNSRNVAASVYAIMVIGVITIIALLCIFLGSNETEQFVFSKDGFEINDSESQTFYSKNEGAVIKSDSLYYNESMYTKSSNGFVYTAEQTNNEKEFVNLIDNIMIQFNKDLVGEEVYQTNLYNETISFTVVAFDSEKLELECNYIDVNYSLEITNVLKDFEIYEEDLEEDKEDLEEDKEEDLEEEIVDSFIFSNDGFLVSEVSNDITQYYFYSSESNNTMLVEKNDLFNYYLFDGENVYYTSNEELNFNDLVFKSFLDAELTAELETEYKEKLENLKIELKEMSLALNNNDEISTFDLDLLVSDVENINIIENTLEAIKATTTLGTWNIENANFSYEVESFVGDLEWPSDEELEEEVNTFEYNKSGWAIQQTSGTNKIRNTFFYLSEVDQIMVYHTYYLALGKVYSYVYDYGNGIYYTTALTTSDVVSFTNIATVALTQTTDETIIAECNQYKDEMIALRNDARGNESLTRSGFVGEFTLILTTNINGSLGGDIHWDGISYGTYTGQNVVIDFQNLS